MKTRNLTFSQLRNLVNRSPLGRGLPLIPLVLICLAFSPSARAQLSPAPDGDYPNANTAEGEDALFSLSTGNHNTALGFNALYSNNGGVYNTATGAYALYSNTIGSDNAATGSQALYSNITGNHNTANGYSALYSNTASNNTAAGSEALLFNTTGNSNTANGAFALIFNKTGSNNTATGSQALQSNTGSNNTATGSLALVHNTTGSGNTAMGLRALLNSTGSNNIGLGFNAGINLTTGSGNVCIGSSVSGVAGESNTTRIRNVYSSVASAQVVYVNSDDKIGTLASSRRFKDEIKPMNKASQTILALKPVTFRYKPEFDPGRTPMFGLVAEEVEKVNPDLVTRNDKGEVESVRYDAVNAMLLNEFLKEHRQVQEQQKQIENLTALVKEQAAKIQKVSDKVEMSRPAPQMVDNDQ